MGNFRQDLHRGTLRVVEDTLKINRLAECFATCGYCTPLNVRLRRETI